MKQLFFKTVRSNGDSCWATGVLNHNYEVGKHYTFPVDRPAHGFTRPDWYDETEGLEYTYRMRREGSCGNRLLLCLGEGRHRRVPIVSLWWYREKGTRTISLYQLPVMNYDDAPDVFAATDFEVIGEVFVPSSWVGPEETKDNLPVFVD